MAKQLGVKVGGKVYGAGVGISPSETGPSVGPDMGREEESFQKYPYSMKLLTN